MGLEGNNGTTEEENATGVIQHALELGCTMIDTADAYGNGHNEQLAGRAVYHRRSQAFIATRFGIVFDPGETGTEVPMGWGFSLTINGKPEYALKAIDHSLKRLGIRHIVPIPGTRKRQRVTQNAKAAEIIFSPDIIGKISDLATPGLASGQTLL